MSYKTNYELWNPALTSRRPSQMSEIDLVLSQTYPHVAMLPYMQCQHCNPYIHEEPGSPSPSSYTTMSTASGESEETFDSLFTETKPVESEYTNNSKGRKIRWRLRQLLKRSPRSNNGIA